MADHASAGNIIRQLRKEHGYTGEELARQTNLSQSKISKIETGQYPHLQLQDIEKILNTLHASSAIRQQITAGFEVQLLGSYRLYRYKYNSPFDTTLEDERKTSFLCSFVMSALPALLQTMEYRGALLKRYELHEEDYMLAMKVCLKRQDLLWDKDHRFHFIIHEAALYSVPANRKVQLAQLDRLERFIGVPHIKVGIVPLEAGLPPVENGNFVLYDQRQLTIMSATSEVRLTDASDIAVYKKIFTELDQKASYEESASHLVQKAVDFFRNR